MSLYLYHATDRKNLESIKQNGLLINPPEHAFKEEIGVAALKGKIFLALDADVAEAYAECADECPDDIVVFKVDIDSLNQDNFEYDWNNRCEYYKDINSCVYNLRANTRDFSHEIQPFLHMYFTNYYNIS